jgi:methyl-accepting chemotaxis protein
MKIKGKMLVSFLVVILIVLTVFVWGIVSVMRNSEAIKVVEGEVVPATMSLLELQLCVVQIQQWLTDISATKAAVGYDDGFKEAERYYLRANEILDQLIKEHENESEFHQKLVKNKEALASYYEMGKRMANAYINEGTEAGNRIMDQFDKVAEKLREPLGAMVNEHRKELKASVEGINSRSIFIEIFFIIGALMATILSIIIALFITNMITRPLNTLVRRLKDISEGEGDLTARLEVKSKDELGDVALNFNTFIESIHDIVAQVMVAAQNLAQAVDQITTGNQNLSQRTSEQASSLEEIASTIEEATATIKQNADNAQEANQMSEDSLRLGNEGDQVVIEAVESINDISQSSKKIGDIISVINEIAFQTNLLALNAAVEAARAGEQGRGFAVVAGEVRNLAQRAGSAAKEIGQLIKDSVDKIDRGTALSNKSGEALKEIVESIKKMVQFISEIAVASEEQRQGIDQINVAISEMDSMTQQNAALVEETASASEEMANQAQELIEMMGKFKLNDAVKDMVDSAHHKEIHLRAAQLETSRMPAKKGNGDGKKPSAGMIDSQKAVKEALVEEGFEEF